MIEKKGTINHEESLEKSVLFADESSTNKVFAAIMNERENVMNDNCDPKLVFQLNHVCWELIELIGRTGIASTAAINDVLSQKLGNVDSQGLTVESQILCALAECCDSGLLEKVVIESPLFGITYAYQLSENGKKVFYLRFHDKPCASEMDIMKRRCGSVVHGYEIRYISGMLRESGCDVVDITGDFYMNSCYLPDITCEDNEHRPIHIKYETCKCSQNEFNKLCQSIAHALKDLYIITPEGSDQLPALKERLSRWIYAAEESELEGVHVYASTVSGLKGKNIWDPSSWSLRCVPLSVKRRAKAK